MIQEGRESDAAFGAAEGSLGKSHRQRAHHRGIKAIELVFELELVLRGTGWQRRENPVLVTVEHPDAHVRLCVWLSWGKASPGSSYTNPGCRHPGESRQI